VVDFTPWATPLYASLFRGPFLVGGVLVFSADEDACRVCRRVSLEVFYGLKGVPNAEEV